MARGSYMPKAKVSAENLVQQDTEIVRHIEAFVQAQRQVKPNKHEQRIIKEVASSRFFLLFGPGFSLSSAPEYGRPWRKPPRVVATIAPLGVEIRPILLLSPEDGIRPRPDIWHWAGRGRLLLAAETAERVEITVRRVSEAMHSLFPVFHGLRVPNNFFPYRIPKSILRNRTLRKTDLEGVERVIGNNSDELLPFRVRLAETIVIPERSMAYVFFYLPVVCELDFLFDAAHFYQQSMVDYEFVGDQVNNILKDPEARPDFEADRLSLENIVLSAFRSIEALVGEPGKTDRFRERLRQRGIDPGEPVGFRGHQRAPMEERIKWLHLRRDESAAHGRRRRKDALTFKEAMEAQHIAKAVLLRAIVHAAVLRGRPDGTNRERRYLLRQMFGRKQLAEVHRAIGTQPEILVSNPGGLRQVLQNARH